jgi:prophage regulatory protein
MDPNRLLRLTEIIGRKASPNHPALPALIPVSRTTWWEGVRTGRYPKPVLISKGCVAWRAEDVVRTIHEMNARDGGVA